MWTVERIHWYFHYCAKNTSPGLCAHKNRRPHKLVSTVIGVLCFLFSESRRLESIVVSFSFLARIIFSFDKRQAGGGGGGGVEKMPQVERNTIKVGGTD